jgi:hypothetical protein
VQLEQSNNDPNYARIRNKRPNDTGSVKVYSVLMTNYDNNSRNVVRLNLC